MIENDDILHRVDAHYLGPAGHTFPMRIRYSAAGVGAGIFFLIFVTARAIMHAPLGFKSLALMVAVTVVLTSKVTKYVNADRPLRSVIRAAWNDLVAPRPPKPGQTVLIDVPQPLATRDTSQRPHTKVKSST